MPTVLPGTYDPGANGPRRYQIVARCATAGPNVFVFCGVVHDQGALLNILAALVERGLMLQSVRRLEHDELLEPMCGQKP